MLVAAATRSRTPFEVYQGPLRPRCWPVAKSHSRARRRHRGSCWLANGCPTLPQASPTSGTKRLSDAQERLAAARSPCSALPIAGILSSDVSAAAAVACPVLRLCAKVIRQRHAAASGGTIWPGAGSVTTISARQLMRMVCMKRLTAMVIVMNMHFCCCSRNSNCNFEYQTGHLEFDQRVGRSACSNDKLP